MAIFATTIRDYRKKPGDRPAAGTRAWRTVLGTMLAALPVLILAGSASAQTVGNVGLASGAEVLSVFTGSGALPQPNDPTKFVDFTNTFYGYIHNPYIGVVQGVGGTYSVTYPSGTSTISLTHNIAGMLSFGNLKGSARFQTDDGQAMNGFGSLEAYFSNGRPVGYAVWPLASNWETTNPISFDFSAYTRAMVDGTEIGILGSTGAQTEPQFVDNVLRTTYDIGNNITMRQEIRLYRCMAQLRWVFQNNDTAPHTVRVRFTVNSRANAINGGGAFNNRTGFFFQDANGNISDNARNLFGADIPDQFNIYGKRYESDNNADPPFSVRHIFRGYGASIPERVTLADPFELRPSQAGYYLNSFTRTKLFEGLGVAVYFGPYVLQPGQTQTVVTYYGNGAPDEIPSDDFTVSADGPEAMAYNAAAATNQVAPGANPNDVIPTFLSPNPLNIFGSIYNQVPSGPQTSVNYTNVRASLTLPTGLAFGTDPATNATDVAEKVIGTVSADRGSDVSWTVKPTGDAYGTLSYQINFSTNELGARQITRTINVPATPFRKVTAAGFQMIGFPFEFDKLTSNNADPTTVVSGLSASPDQAIFYQYLPDPNNDSGFGHYTIVDHLQNGIGYMYKPNQDRTIYAKGVKPVTGQAPLGLTNFTDVQQVQIILEKGWNIISNPYLYQIPLRSLRFVPTTDNTGASSQTFTQAVGTGLIRGGVFFNNGGSQTYDFIEDPAEPLLPWQGYWLFTTSRIALIYAPPAQRLSAVLPAPGADQNPPTRGVIASGRALVTNSTDQNWRLQLVAKQGAKSYDNATIIGVSNDPNLKDTSRSLPKPPPVVKDYVYVGLVKSGTSASRYAKDIRNPGRTNSWDIEVSADKDGPVTLTWPNVNTLPRRVSLTVKDQQSGQAYALRSTSSVTINVTQNKPTRLTITAQQESSQALKITNLRAISTRSNGGRSFAFNLNRDATVTGRVKTISGKTIATLAVSRAATVGENRLQWTGRAQNGSPLPPGPYMIEVVAQSADGEIAPLSVPFFTLE